MPKKKSEAQELREALCSKKKHAALRMDNKEIKTAFDYCGKYMDFLGKAKIERQAAAFTVAEAKKHGYVPFEKGKKYKAGDKVYYLNRGKAVIFAYIGKKDVKEYFPTDEEVRLVHQPLLVTSNDSKFDILINVQGGGLNGQAAACLHGISRALTQVDPNCRTALKANGYLTRDSRMVERKKYGQRGARRRFQFSKR